MLTAAWAVRTTRSPALTIPVPRRVDRVAPEIVDVRRLRISSGVTPHSIAMCWSDVETCVSATIGRRGAGATRRTPSGR